jgi:hypothetical protein
MRSLFLTAHLLHNEGVPVDAETCRGTVRVSIGDPHEDGRFFSAVFPNEQMDQATDWLVARVQELYPTSALARIRALFASAAKACAEGRDL